MCNNNSCYFQSEYMDGGDRVDTPDSGLYDQLSAMRRRKMRMRNDNTYK